MERERERIIRMAGKGALDKRCQGASGEERERRECNTNVYLVRGGPLSSRERTEAGRLRTP